jgi:predicted nucleic acid-binding protein
VSGRAFVDTNIWVYAIDTADRAKQARALEILDPDAEKDYVISAQVLGEFYATVTGKLRTAVTHADGRTMVERMKQLPVVPIDVLLVEAAIAASEAWRISYWDSLIVSAADAARCSILLSEDLAHGQVYGSVEVVNPFVAPRNA